MEIPTPTFHSTPYGEVDAAQLEVLCDSFDTTTLLSAITHMDELSTRLAPAGEIRDDLLRLHSMALAILHGGPLTLPAGEYDCGEEAEALANELRDLAEIILSVAEQLQPLIALRPEPDN